MAHPDIGADPVRRAAGYGSIIAGVVFYIDIMLWVFFYVQLNHCLICQRLRMIEDTIPNFNRRGYFQAVRYRNLDVDAARITRRQVSEQPYRFRSICCDVIGRGCRRKEQRLGWE